MTFNAPLLFETAVLMLAAFLSGAVIGLALRFLLARPKPVAVVVPAVAKPEEPATPQLVKAPEIAPLSTARPMPRGEQDGPQMPAVKMPEMARLEMPTFASIEPSHVAGETVTGRHIDNPEHPHAASLDDVRAELVAQIEASPVDDAAPAKVTTAQSDADIVPADVDAPEPELPRSDAALAAEAAIPMLAEVSDKDAQETLPAQERIEPAIEAQPVVLTDAPDDVAVEIQDVVELPVGEPVPEVVAETPLVEPVYAKPEDEAAAVQPATRPEPADDEMAAMRAIEGGWSPRRTAATRQPADRPEGVSAAEVAAAERAVANSGAAVANATALATAVLDEIAPRPARPAGGFGRPASLAAPRDGHKDNFGQIKGIGPAVESSLNGLGIYHFDQIADWDQKAVVWIENHFGFKGRIARERWQDQARDLVRRKAPVSRPIKR